MRLSPLMRIDDLKVYFNVSPQGAMPWTKHHTLKAIDGVSFELEGGETLGIVGESGCGKSTLARAITRMVPVESGEVVFLGSDLLKLDKQALREHRKRIQMVFQDPLASLNPRMTVGEIIAEPLKTHFPTLSASEVKEAVREVMSKVGLLSNLINRYPHEFSGGQCQRIGIARALILKPKLIICDEPVSALDVSIQAQVINLLKQLQDEMELALIFIAHDLSVVKHISTRILVLYLGNMVELADSADLYAQPQHPYTQALISAVPIPDPEIEKTRELILIEGDLPSPTSPPSGCVFHTRCPHVSERCINERPKLRNVNRGHSVACHLVL
ncbi:MAG: murein tripeptide/oligopeptide ABC transporter ATP binding protein OppF [Arenicellales bacterium]|jgi:oligopeptide transport system ATP-binding protein|nr:oligopeptide ABC transporter ATP-binding protein OppF [Acidiferrobacteraceae bacterium]MDP6122965.1 murein tripeptide/oligopeptide ABC transporter ATP binding protein OppF [Arenicellales bacterium]MDP6289565.1 murein tripeptide/oligopeptide ABC transporter ATP binding protein OppF [Arenicellales bacterium]MDP6434589.1 murein tripeptide/oligopeptide ABC transporter ATP binding protein OppF [Arenicellales bacterium]MDP6672744.1 murein tripeptide/oligopeptide ABC transporter ATP binding protein|tara:strand:+ start:4779 stop:5765 length:987 start_codon:yes stop_codon:yes gene_type:complete